MVVVGLAASVAPASPQAASPLVKSEVIRLLVDDAYTSEERQEIVRRNCLTFSPSESDLDDFRRLGASPGLLEVIRQCGRQADGRPRRVDGGPPEEAVDEVEIPASPGDVAVSPPAALESSDLWLESFSSALDAWSRLPDLQPPARSRSDAADRRPVRGQMPPRLQNPAEVQRTLERIAPAGALAEGREPRCVLWVFVDETGAVRNARIERSSGSDAFDEAALEAARSMRFAPATDDGREIAMWVQQTLSVRR